MKKLLYVAALTTSTICHATSVSWTGLYIGMNGGYQWAHSDAKPALGGDWISLQSPLQRNGIINLFSANLKPTGGIYGIQVGANYQFPNNLIAGFEIEYNHGDIRSSRDIPNQRVPSLGSSYTVSNSIKISDIIKPKAKLGYAIGSTMLYATGGMGINKEEGSAAISSSGGYKKAGSESSWVNGVVYGAGAEIKLRPNLSLRLEYLRGNMENLDYYTAYLPGSTFAPPDFNYSESINQTMATNSILLGVNYQFKPA